MKKVARDDHTRVRRIAGLMIFVAATLAVASALHLSGSVGGRSEPFDAEHAGADLIPQAAALPAVA